MEYSARKFNNDTYLECDTWARNKVIPFLKKNGFNITHKEEDYKLDLVATKNGKTYNIELEVKERYPFTSRADYRFNTVSFLGRKKKFHDEVPFIYIIICKETSCALYCYSKNIYKEEYLERITANTYNRKGTDVCYRVPIEACHFFNEPLI